MTNGSQDCALAGSGGVPIKISRGALHHVLERHGFYGAQTEGESVFYPTDDIIGLIEKSAAAPPQLQHSGNCERLMDAGGAIGMDRATRKATTVYTVITDTTGNLITAFPGRP